MIGPFKNNYRFLSNFYTCEFLWDVMVWPSSEHAYQAAKTNNPYIRESIRVLPTANDAKKAGRKLILRTDWESIKVALMKEILLAKFSQNNQLREQLLATGDEELVEVNWWGDKIWGMVEENGVLVGENNLGKTLMKIRKQLKAGETK